MLKKILKCKWKFFVNKDIDIIFFEKTRLAFNFNNYKVLNYHHDIYLIICFKTILNYIFLNNPKKLKISHFYLYNLVKESNPKLGIGNDALHNVFIFKKLFPKKISMVYQFGYLFNDKKKNYYRDYLKNYTADFYFVYDERSKKILSKLIKSKFIISGSLKANLNCKISKRKNFLYDVMFVSNYRPLVKSYQSYKYTKYFHKNDQFIFKTISNFCKKNNLKLCVAFSSFRDDKEHLNYFEKEKIFFSKLNDNFLVPFKNSYKTAFNSNLVVGSFSNLNYELLISGKKTLVIYKKYNKALQFSKKITKDFVIISDNEKKIEKKINNLLFLEQNKWKKNNLLFYNKKSFFDEKNEIFYRFIKKQIQKVS